MNQAPALKPSIKPAVPKREEPKLDFKEMDNDYFELMQEQSELQELGRKNRGPRKVHYQYL